MKDVAGRLHLAMVAQHNTNVTLMRVGEKGEEKEQGAQQCGSRMKEKNDGARQCCNRREDGTLGGAEKSAWRTARPLNHRCGACLHSKVQAEWGGRREEARVSAGGCAGGCGSR